MTVIQSYIFVKIDRWHEHKKMCHSKFFENNLLTTKGFTILASHEKKIKVQNGTA
jgi:hypothetical protein